MEASLLANVLGCGIAGLTLYAFTEKLLPILPSYPFLILVGMAAGGHPASIGLSLLSITLGSILGAMALFVVGRHVPEPRIRSFAVRFGRYLLLSVGRYDRLIAAYRGRHFCVTLFSQFIPLARNYTALSAGAVGVAFVPFLFATIPGALLWNASFLAVGYFLGTSG